MPNPQAPLKVSLEPSAGIDNVKNLIVTPRDPIAA